MKSRQKNKGILHTAAMGFVIFMTAAVGAAASTPFDSLDAGDREQVETGLILFEQVQQRIWSASGTLMGNLGLLERANRTYESVSNPAVRYYLIARVELARGRVMENSRRRAQVRRHYKNAIRITQESLKFQENADAYRVLAEAGYAWMEATLWGGRVRMGDEILTWSEKALSLDPENALAALMRAVALEKMREDKAMAIGILERLEQRTDLSSIERFRTLLSLSRMHRGDRAKKWCAKAAQIFPDNPAVRKCVD